MLEKIKIELTRYELQIITRWVVDKDFELPLYQSDGKTINQWKPITRNLAEKLYQICDELDLWGEDPNRIPQPHNQI